MFNILLKNERHFGARSFTCNGIGDALIGAGSALVGSAFSSQQVKSQQAWQDAQRRAQEGFVRSMWNANNEYNTPANQMKRLQAAGINPWMNLGQSQSASGQSSQVASAGSAPSAPSGFNYNPVTGISSIASAFKSIADAKKAGVETTQLEKTMKDTMRKIAADADSSEYIAIMNQANSSVANEKAAKEMQELTEKVKLLREQVFNAGEEGKLITEKALRETEERYLTIAKRNLAKGEYDLVKKNYDSFDKRLKAELDESRSRTNKNNEEAIDMRETRSARTAALKASARYQNASASEREMLNEVTSMDVNTIKEHGLTYVESIKNKINYSNYFNKNQKDLFDSQLDLLKKQIVIAQKTGDWYGVSILLGGVKDLATAGAILAK